MIIADPSVRFCELGPDYYTRLDAGRQTRNRIRELERLNPGMKVTLAPQSRPPDPSTRPSATCPHSATPKPVGPGSSPPKGG